MATDVRRSRGLAAVVVLCLVVALIAATLPAMVVGESLPARQGLVFLVAPLKIVIALTGLLVGHGAIAGARSGGQLRLLLTLPITRTSLVAGALVGRAAITVAGVAVAVLAVSVAFPLVYGSLPLGALVAFGVLLAWLGVTLTAVAIGLSAGVRSRGRAAVVAISLFVLFEFFWGIVPAGIHYVIEGSLPGAVVPAWVVLLERLQPLTAFETLASEVLPTVQETVTVSPGGAAAGETMSPRSLETRLGGPPPRYLDPEVGVATLIAWAVIPLAMGWYRFVRSDL